MAIFKLSTAFLLLSCLSTVAFSQNDSDIPNSFPNDYPGKPSGDFSPAWQDCTLDFVLECVHDSQIISSDFLVKDPLPNITFPINRNFAGNIPVNRAGHPNDTLFFWAFEQKQGSLTASAKEDSTTPWGIWLNGGYEHHMLSSK